MPDLKISGLTVDASPSGSDYVETLDVSDTTMGASGSNKRVLVSSLLALGGGGGGGSGTVTSVALTTPGVLFSVAGSPVTTSGTLAMSLVAQAAHAVLAGPTTGANATPTMRALVAADIPAIAESQVTGLVSDLSTLTSGVAAAALDSAAVHKTGAETIAGAKTFSSTIVGSVSGNAATVTTNANLTGPVTSTGNATAIANGAITAAMLASTAVTPGSYTSSNITVDAQGRITAAASGSGGGATIASTSSVLKGDGAGNGVAATAGTDYVKPGGVSGGQTIDGDTASAGNLTLNSTAHATKGSVFFNGSAWFIDASGNLTIGTTISTALGSSSLILTTNGKSLVLNNSGDFHVDDGDLYGNYGLYLGNSAGTGLSLRNGGPILMAPGTGSPDAGFARSAAAVVKSTDGSTGYGDHAARALFINKNAAPADGELVAGQLALWFDSTNGAGKLMVKAKTANGTVVTGSVTLA